MRIEHAHAGYELILIAPSPFPQFEFGSDLVGSRLAVRIRNERFQFLSDEQVI